MSVHVGERNLTGGVHFNQGETKTLAKISESTVVCATNNIPIYSAVPYPFHTQ